MAERDELLNHNYDGIQEYDNDLPRWWLQLFLLTFVFAVFYVAYQHTSLSPTDDEHLQMELAKLDEMKQAGQPAAKPVESVEAMLVALTQKPEAMAVGKKVWDERCVACHLAQGQGLVGPNLTDNYWIHGGKITDTLHIIKKGVPEKGMIAWEAIMSPEELNAVTAYIYTLRGTNPPNAKAPEGEPYEG